MILKVEFSTRNKTTAIQQLRKIIGDMDSKRVSGTGWKLTNGKSKAKTKKKEA